MARPVLKSLSLPSHGLDLQPTPNQQEKGWRRGAVAWLFRQKGEKGQVEGGSSLGNCACPTSLPKELAEDKDLGAKCLPGIGREELGM